MSSADRPRILITGATGFVGCHLTRLLRQETSGELVGLSLHRQWPEHAPDLARSVPLVSVNLLEPDRVLEVLRDFAPTHIYHLAGYAEVSRSYREPDAAWEGNLTATRRLYDAVLTWGGRPRILYVSSGAVYGEPTDPTQPITERTELRPNSPYATSKAAADLLSFEMTCSRGMDIIRVRPFNHIGPGQSPRYALASFAEQLAAIEKGLQPPVLRVGNLASQRDLTDVRDVVAAYRLLMQRAQAGSVFNVASGITLPMQTYLDLMLGLSSVKVRVEVDPALLRPVDTATVRVDVSALKSLTGWQPRIPMAQTVADLFNYWRSQVGNKALAEGS
ncbi:MAG: GDP-mannose 4,6-dehydratase [Gemmatales bacterium]|nr:GDP-mannose 4,6-dehydratase [Gemmatales bacterium]MDW8385693.1 GDP-mannose 4,6-dehydratase [Gemmatales bacterium]